MKDIKSIFEKIGLIEKVQTNEGTINEEEDSSADDPQTNETTADDNMKKINAESRKAVNGPVVKNEQKKLLRAGEIYNNYHIKAEGTDSLFIVEKFLKALPDYLPLNVKRQSVLDIIESSDMSLESLSKDGNDRLKCLKDFINTFSYEIKDTTRQDEDEIKKLTEKINMYNKQIDYLEKLQVEQAAVVDYESERVKNILKLIAADQL